VVLRYEKILHTLQTAVDDGKKYTAELNATMGRGSKSAGDRNSCSRRHHLQSSPDNSLDYADRWEWQNKYYEKHCRLADCAGRTCGNWPTVDKIGAAQFASGVA
jgi:hypothetical protein